VTSFGTFPGEIDLAILVGALAAAAAGGANNLVQSNWIRDKGFGMGRYAPRIVSPITGEEEAAPTGDRFDFPVDEANLSRWQVWWKRANIEQFVSFVVIGLIAIFVFSLVAYSTVYRHPDLPDSSGFDFIALESDVLKSDVGNWFGTLFLVVGAVSLFAAALGIVDYVGRLVADVIYVGYTRRSRRWTESRLYFTVVWCLIAFGCTILLLGFDQPLVLLTISTVLGGGLMVIYTCLLLITNRRYLPKEIELGGFRRLVLIASVLLLGTVTVIVGIDQFKQLF
jgi:Mn2+/Fe2+ NRAMP family transporter